jgi:plastocyanin
VKEEIMGDDVERRMQNVTVIKEGSACMIKPAETLLAVGDRVTFYNLTGDPITVMFPDVNLFGKYVVEVETEQSDPLTVAQKTELGSFPYSVFCHGINDFAHASLPRIIVYRKY